jgi:hypothetical protein
MKRTYRFVEPSGVVACRIGEAPFDLPLFAGVLKHPTVEQLRGLLVDPVVASKYTREALRKLPWSALRRFPEGALIACLPQAELSEARRRAIEFMLGITTSPATLTREELRASREP